MGEDGDAASRTLTPMLSTLKAALNAAFFYCQASAPKGIPAADWNEQKGVPDTPFNSITL
jgi:hypothetical protein